MNENHVSSTATSTDTAHVGGKPASPVAMPQPPAAAVRPSRWTGGRITALVIGSLLVLVSVGLLGGGAVALWADATQRDAAGYVTTDVHTFSTSGSALATEPAELDSPGVGWLYSSGPARERPDPRHAGEHRLGAVRGDRPLRRGRPLPRRGEPHGHLGLLDERGGGDRWRHARIGSRNAGLLGRLRHRPGRPDPDVGSRQRVVDGGRDERRRATRGRCGSGPGSRVSGSAGDRHRRAGDRRALPGRRRLS